MATRTAFLGLAKPDYSDVQDVGVINANMEILDDAVHKASSKIQYTTVNRKYVDIQNGNDDTGDGTSNKPYKTLEKLFEEANTTSTDIRCYLVSAGDYHVAKSVINAVVVHITATVEGVNLIFDSGSLAIYNSHLNIAGASGKNINIYGDFYVEGGTAAFDYCNIRARIGSYFARMSYGNCTVYDPQRQPGAEYIADNYIIWNRGSNVVLSAMTMNNTRNTGSIFYCYQCTVLISGSWAENNTTDVADGETCFLEVAYSLVNILATKRVITNPYRYALKNASAVVIFRSEDFYNSWRTRCGAGDFSMPNAGIITYYPMRPIVLRATGEDGATHTYQVIGREV